VVVLLWLPPQSFTKELGLGTSAAGARLEVGTRRRRKRRRGRGTGLQIGILVSAAETLPRLFLHLHLRTLLGGLNTGHRWSRSTGTPHTVRVGAQCPDGAGGAQGASDETSSHLGSRCPGPILWTAADST